MQSRHNSFVKRDRGQVSITVIDLADAIENRNPHCFNQAVDRLWSLVVDHYRNGSRRSQEEITVRLNGTVGGDGHHAPRRESTGQHIDQLLFSLIISVALRDPGDPKGTRQASEQISPKAESKFPTFSRFSRHSRQPTSSV